MQTDLDYSTGGNQLNASHGLSPSKKVSKLKFYFSSSSMGPFSTHSPGHAWRICLLRPSTGTACATYFARKRNVYPCLSPSTFGVSLALFHSNTTNSLPGRPQNERNEAEPCRKKITCKPSMSPVYSATLFVVEPKLMHTLPTCALTA